MHPELGASDVDNAHAADFLLLFFTMTTMEQSAQEHKLWK